MLRTPRTYQLSPERVQSGAHVLRLLADAEAVKRIIEQVRILSSLYTQAELIRIKYYQVSPTVVAPWVSMSRCLDSVLATVQACTSDQERELLARKVFKQTFIPIDVDENTTPENLHLACTGPRLRFEIIGVIIVYYVMGCLVADQEQLNLVARQGGQYLLELTHASNLCVSFCDRTESLNDILLWLLHANVILLTFQYGDASGSPNSNIVLECSL
jgi:hypothetical protein